MNHADSAGESANTRKMAHAPLFPRRASSEGTQTIASVSNNVATPEDYQPSQMMQHSSPIGASTTSLQLPPQSLNFPAQTLSSAGAQMKKKSGFQITSVMPAQASVSTNNSIAEDTESYDDPDESHTEDLSSSEILDASLSRATDLGVPERSSSEETLNNFHEAETPSAVSPNQPPLHGKASQAHHHGTMVNGTAHHHHHHHHHHPHAGHHHPVPSAQPVVTASPVLAAEAASVAVASGVCEGGLSSGMLPSIVQKAVAPIAESKVNAGAVPAMMLAAGVHSMTSNVNRLGLAAVPIIAAQANQGVNVIQKSGASVSASSSGGSGLPGMPVPHLGAPGPIQTPPAVAISQGHQVQQQQSQPTPCASTASSSRFRVVKLDSSSEPFKKGRWMCTEFYDKETGPPAAPAQAEGAKLPAVIPEGISGSELESTSSSSVSSTVSTQGHYTESGEIGLSSMVAPTYSQEYAAQPSGIQAGVQPDLLQTFMKTSTQLPATIVTPQPQAPVNLVPLPQSMVHQVPAPVAPQQTSYPPGPVAQTIPVVYPAPAPGASLPVIQPSTVLQSPQPQLATATGSRTVTAGTGHHPGVSQLLPQQLSQMLPGSVTVLGQQLKKPQPLLNEPVPPQGGLSGPLMSAVAMSQVMPNVPPSLPHDPQSSPPVTTSHLPAPGQQLPPGSTHFTGLPNVTAAQLQDAQLLLIQHHSLAGTGDGTSDAGTSAGAEAGGSANALAASAGLLPLKNLPVDGEDDGSSGASVVAIDNKIEQAMDLVKSHLMYAVREEVEVLKEQIKELIERNSQLEQENSLLKNLASPEQLAQFQAQVQSGSPPAPTQPPGTVAQQPLPPAQPTAQSSGPSA